MKKLAILTSILALTACGGGSGGGSAPAPVWSENENITQEMLQNNRSAQSQEIAKKLETIAYVEDKLGSLIGEDGELQGIPNDNANIHSATTDKMSGGLLLKDIEARYKQALGYFNILNKVMNANENSNDITNKEIAIAYSLSNGVCYDEPETKQAIQTNFGISVEEQTEETTVVNINLLVVNIQITIKEQVKNNEELKEAVTEEITEEIPVLKPEEPETPNEEEPEKPISIDETRFANIKYAFAEDNIENLSFKVEDGVIKSVVLAEERMLGDFVRKGNTNVYADTGYSFYVPVTHNMFYTWVSENPKESEKGLAELRQFLQSAIEGHYCYGNCVTYATHMLEEGTYTVTQEADNSYKVEFPHESTWSDLFMSKDFAEKNIIGNIKGQQLYYLQERGFIDDEEAEQIRNDSTITNVLDVEGICGGRVDSDCMPALESIAAGNATWSETTLEFELDTEDTTELSYASFGTVGIKAINVDGNNYNGKVLIAGGDVTKKIDVNNITSDTSFRGKAIGIAERFDDDDNETFSDKFTTNNATLTFNANSKGETLYMPFATDGNNYYDVTVVRNDQESDPEFTFVNENNVQDMYKIPSLTGNNIPYDEPETYMHTGYYGDNNSVSEVAGTVRYEEADKNGGSVGFEGAFGMKQTR